MLVLSRRKNDQIDFPTLGIRLQVLRVGRGKVCLGIDAPPEVKVLRQELNEFPDHSSSDTGSATLDQGMVGGRMQRHFEAASQTLSRLRQESAGDESSSLLVCEAIHHLRSIERQAKRDAERGAAAQKRQRKALLVEDNKNESRLLAQYLRLRDFDVAVAHDGEEALEYLERNAEPDFVLLDMQMSGMDGPTALQHMRSRGRYHGLRVFAVSGGDPADYGVSVNPEGVDGWFPKPLDPEELVVRLADYDAPACRGNTSHARLK